MYTLCRFDKTQYPPYGFFVDSINGLANDPANEMFWALLMRDATGDCLSNVGQYCALIPDFCGLSLCA